MKYSYKLSDAIHILTYIDIIPDESISSNDIAESIEANPSVVRKLMANLKKAGLLESQVGAAHPKLAKPADTITLLDVFKAVETNHDLLHVDPRTNMNCPVGANIQQTLNDAYKRVQKAAEDEMSNLTIQDMIDSIQDLRQQKNS
ncbi:transcriptional regulator [Companilactobacillus tucceti DSM 20183]|uniref:Transcriptional regulator n=1 Tax=Companilactobacillus tucceti DSM 20183 TaxID=1423811 RepID=A0A0R1J279_9LACO|nr:Rrf2 family transcriptional regulator [Companilactobacillus tucceti]KRK65324.1 transcriptional regulator [Companilactobacillus tucceti DSM 20183]